MPNDALSIIDDLEVIQTLVMREARVESPNLNRVRERITTFVVQCKALNADLYNAARVYGNTVLSVLASTEMESTPMRATLKKLQEAYSGLMLVAERVEPTFKSKEEKFDSEDRELLASFRPAEVALRNGITHNQLYFGNAPIITMLALDRSKLLTAGIPNKVLSGYTVLLNQAVVGVSAAFIEAQIERHLEDVGGSAGVSDLAKKYRRVRTVESIDRVTREASLTIAKEALDIFLARRPHFDVIGENGYAWRGARWFWLMPKSDTPRFRAAAFSSKGTGLAHWAFAFEGASKLKSQPR